MIGSLLTVGLLLLSSVPPDSCAGWRDRYVNALRRRPCEAARILTQCSPEDTIPGQVAQRCEAQKARAAELIRKAAEEAKRAEAEAQERAEAERRRVEAKQQPKQPEGGGKETRPRARRPDDAPSGPDRKAPEHPQDIPSPEPLDDREDSRWVREPHWSLRYARVIPRPWARTPWWAAATRRFPNTAAVAAAARASFSVGGGGFAGLTGYGWTPAGDGAELRVGELDGVYLPLAVVHWAHDLGFMSSEFEVAYRPWPVANNFGSVDAGASPGFRSGEIDWARFSGLARIDFLVPAVRWQWGRFDAWVRLGTLEADEHLLAYSIQGAPLRVQALPQTGFSLSDVRRSVGGSITLRRLFESVLFGEDEDLQAIDPRDPRSHGAFPISVEADLFVNAVATSELAFRSRVAYVNERWANSDRQGRLDGFSGWTHCLFGEITLDVALGAADDVLTASAWGGWRRYEPASSSGHARDDSATYGLAAHLSLAGFNAGVTFQADSSGSPDPFDAWGSSRPRGPVDLDLVGLPVTTIDSYFAAHVGYHLEPWLGIWAGGYAGDLNGTSFRARISIPGAEYLFVEARWDVVPGEKGIGHLATGSFGAQLAR